MVETGNLKNEALLLLGCPQVPVQTSLALYAAHNLRKQGCRPVIAGTPAARKLMEVADPEAFFTREIVTVDGARVLPGKEVRS